MSAHRRITAALVSVAAAAGLALTAAPAQAAHGTFCTNVLLQQGGSQTTANTCIHTVQRTMYKITADAISSAKPCAQLYSGSPSPTAGTLIANNCSNTDGSSVTLTGTLPGFPGVHNHSTHQGRFNGSFDY